MHVGLKFAVFRSVTPTVSTQTVSVGFFLQLGPWQADIQGEIMQCFRSLIAAAQADGFRFQLYLSVTPELYRDKALISMFSSKLHKEHFHLLLDENEDFDIGPFLTQLSHYDVREHDFIIKIFSKPDPILLERSVQCLCGTRLQVSSVIRAFNLQPDTDMITPLGVTYNPSTSRDNLFPHILRQYMNYEAPGAGFDAPTVARAITLCGEMGEGCQNFDRHAMAMVTGNMFWARNSDIFKRHLPSLVPFENAPLFAKSYADKATVEHDLERLIPSMIRFRGKQIYQIQPAPKPIALYFPQYHAFQENDAFWGKGFTEWNLLNKTQFNVRTPLPLEEGGLGYYNLLESKIRAKQAKIAREHGIYGFCYYHYWFSGERAPTRHKVMFKIIEEMLSDGEPDIPFMLSWANEPWLRTWTGVDSGDADDTLIEQSYGDEEDWREHFKYLSRFFNHPNYIRIRGKPVFAIYRVGHFKEKFKPMMTLWKTLAREYGYAGLHLVDTMNNFFLSGIDSDGPDELNDLIDAAFHFQVGVPASSKDFPTRSGLRLPQYWGATTSFDRRPRVGDHNYPVLRTPGEFRSSYLTMIQQLSALPGRETDQGFNFICAWNEWNEQAVLEPDKRWRFQFLEGILSSLSMVPVQPVF